MKHFTKIFEALAIAAFFGLHVFILWLVADNAEFLPVGLVWFCAVATVLNIWAFTRALIFDCLTD